MTLPDKLILIIISLGLLLLIVFCEVQSHLEKVEVVQAALPVWSGKGWSPANFKIDNASGTPVITITNDNLYPTLESPTPTKVCRHFGDGFCQ